MICTVQCWEMKHGGTSYTQSWNTSEQFPTARTTALNDHSIIPAICIQYTVQLHVCHCDIGMAMSAT